MFADDRPTEMKVEMAGLPLGEYEPDPGTEIPVFISFMQVGAALAGATATRHAQAYGWAKLERRGAAVWARLSWNPCSLEWFFALEPGTELELAYAATVRGRPGDPRPDDQLERILFLVIRRRS